MLDLQIRQLPLLIKKEINYLKSSQQKDGSFESFSSASPNSLKNTKKYKLTFPASLIVYSLNHLTPFTNPSLIKAIQKKAVAFLLQQKSPHWSFNYWSRDSKEISSWPDDLDDTCCALLALYTFNPKLVSGAVLAQLTGLLTATEVKEGGPYRTWLVAPQSLKIWKDIDLAVNNNIGYFLSLQGVSLPNLQKFTEKAITQKKLKSPYYSTFLTLYFISRLYRGPKKKNLVNFILAQRNKRHYWSNPLDSALAILALLNLGYPAPKLKESLAFLISQMKTSRYKFQQFCLEPAIRHKQYYAISPALTTALCLEALGKYHSLAVPPPQKKSEKQSSKQKISKAQENIRRTIIKTARQKFQSLQGNLQKESLAVLQKTLQNEKKQLITLTPYFFYKSLTKSNKVSQKTIVQLGLANLYGWIAYTIYDDFLDDEGNPKLLPLANVCLRELTAIFKEQIPQRHFSSLFTKTMNQLESANAWEAAHCRISVQESTLKIPSSLPRCQYLHLADRSLGHALGPLTILSQLNYSKKDQDIKDTILFFQHYLAARQLNDDAHDWEEDLSKGHLSIVVTSILKKWLAENKAQLNARNKKNQRRQINLKKDLPHLQEIFWHKTITQISKKTLEHTALARKQLGKISQLKDPAILEAMLIPIEKSVQKALDEQKQTLEFLQSYKFS